jgi:hypothetical protein
MRHEAVAALSVEPQYVLLPAAMSACWTARVSPQQPAAVPPLLLQVTGLHFIDRGRKVLVATSHGVEVRRNAVL